MQIKREHSSSRRAARRWLQVFTTFVAALVLTTGLAAQPATATTKAFIKHGSDIGELSTTGKRMACDNEADGNTVYIEVMNDAGETIRTTDNTGSADGVCVVSTKYHIAINFTKWIRVCENINNRPDNCTDKLYI